MGLLTSFAKPGSDPALINGGGDAIVHQKRRSSSSSATQSVIADAKESRASKNHPGDSRDAPTSDAALPTTAARKESGHSHSHSQSLSNYSAPGKTENLCDAEDGPLPKCCVPKPKKKPKPDLLFKTSKTNVMSIDDSSENSSSIKTSSHTDPALNFRANASDDDGDDDDDEDLSHVLASDDNGANFVLKEALGEYTSVSAKPSQPSAPAAIHRPRRRPSSIVSYHDGNDDCETLFTEDLSDDTSGDLNDLDVRAKSMLERLGEFPSQAQLSNVAAVRANEYINECLFAKNGHREGATAGIIDRSKWESIPQYSKSDLMIRRHLGKGSFSDAFEVAVRVTVEEEKLDLSDKEDLDKRIEAKLASAKIGEEGEDDDDDYDTLLIDAMFADDPTPATEKLVDFQHTTFATAPAQTEARRPGRVRRHTVDHGVSASLCVVSNIQAGKTSDRLVASLVRKKEVTYAMKCLRPKIRHNADQFIVGVEDLVHETAVLASLDHPNIIKLHGRAASDSLRLSDGYFVLLDRLVDTLEDRMDHWRAIRAAAGGRGSGIGGKIGSRAAPPSLPQLQAARSVADALAYLHSKDIAFRDLKPANVGFDARGTLKLFDFGFAVGVDGDTALHEVCGTPRYMAPEVGLGEGYGTPADVHSFGILFWQILALKKPFRKIKLPEEFRNEVFWRGLRPKLAKGWPRCLREAMAACWTVEPGERPTMDVVAGVLDAHLREVTSSSSRRGNGGLLRRSFRRFSG